MSESVKEYTLAPSILVILKTERVGNRHYLHEVLEGTHLVKAGADKGKVVRKWNTTSIIDDPEEAEAARATVSSVWSTIAPLCRSTDFGLMAPESKREELLKAVPEAYAIADAFNKTAKVERVRVSIMLGTVTADDVLAERAMRRDVEDLIAKMQDGVAKLDVKAVRDAKAELTRVKEMLSEDARSKAEGAIKIAADSANELAKAIRKLEKAGETVALEVDAAALEALEAARVDFLNLDDSDAAIRISDDVDDRDIRLD